MDTHSIAKSAGQNAQRLGSSRLGERLKLPNGVWGKNQSRQQVLKHRYATKHIPDYEELLKFFITETNLYS